MYIKCKICVGLVKQKACAMSVQQECSLAIQIWDFNNDDFS